MRADVTLSRVSFVLDVMAPLMWRAKINPGVDVRQLVHAERLETTEPVHTEAGVGVSSKLWLRDNALYAQGRSKTQWLTPYRALMIRFIPWLSSEALSSPTPLPHPCRNVCRSKAVWRFNME